MEGGHISICGLCVCLLGKMLFFSLVVTFAFVLAYVANKPFNVDIVLVGKVTFQIASIIAFVLAHVATKPCAASCCFAHLFLQRLIL